MDAQSDLQGSAANGNRPSPATHVSATVRLEFKAPDWLPRTSSHELRKARAGTQGAQTRQLWVLEHNSKREVPVVPPPFPHSALHPIGQGYRKPGPRMGVQKASISCDPARQGGGSRSRPTTFQVKAADLSTLRGVAAGMFCRTLASIEFKRHVLAQQLVSVNLTCHQTIMSYFSDGAARHTAAMLKAMTETIHGDWSTVHSSLLRTYVGEHQD